ncbi:MAG: hypothetical protein ACP5I2_04265 [Fervidicoccaceae archaeon]|nr:MAG: hypothetical protein C0179_03880 [Fervidicoccus sp.]
MNPLKAIIEERERRTRAGNPGYTVLKLSLIILSVLSIFFPEKILITTSISLASILILLFYGSGSIVLGGISLFLFTIGPIDAMSLYFGAEPSRVVEVTSYTFSTMSSMTLFLATTSNEDMETLFGRNFVVYIYSSIFYFMISFSNIEDSFKSRGYEAKLRKPWSYVPVLIAYIYALSEKLSRIDESIEARGAE